MRGNVLITGGLGYLGGRISEYLSKQDTYNIALGTRKNDVHKPGWLNKGKLKTMDYMSDTSLLKACEGMDSIVHLAALNENDSKANPELALLINGMGTLKLLKAAKSAGAKRFIYFSTAHVYGNLTGKITERSLPRPTHPYAITHRVAEDFVLAYQSDSMECIVVRLSNGFGMPMDPNVDRWTLIANDLCRQAVTQKKLVLKSAGQQSRDFITLTDVSRAVDHLLQVPRHMLSDGLFNVGGEYTLKIIDLAELIANRCQFVLGYKPPIEKPEESYTMSSSEPFSYNIDKIKGTGFYLIKNIEEEIDSTLSFCMNAFGNQKK